MNGQVLLEQMDRAAAANNVVRLCALARLNWRLVDAGLLAFSAQRVAAAQQMAVQQRAVDQEARRHAEETRLRNKLADDRTNWALGQAAISIGESPSAYMVSSPASSAGWGASAPSGTDPAAQIYAAVHEGLAIAARLSGAPDPGVAPALARSAADILDGRVNAAAAVKLLGDAAPLALRMVAAIPFLGDQLIGPLIAWGAANALPLAELYRRMPTALLAGQPVPAPVPAIAAAAAPSAGMAPPTLEALLAQALAAAPEQADALYARALAAVEATTTIDDDIVVLRQLAQAGGDRAPGPTIVRRAEKLVSGMAARAERRDDVAHLLAWVARAAIAHRLTELGPRLLASSHAVLEATTLGAGAAVDLTDATCELLVRAGKPDKAALLLDIIGRRVSDAGSRKALDATRARIAALAPATPAR